MVFSRIPVEFHLGTYLEAYRELGAHGVSKKNNEGFAFRTWAPSAKKVEVIGEWNHWSGQAMEYDETGVWSLYIPEARCGQMYKYRITGKDDVIRDKADPYAFRSELRPGTASVVWNMDGLSFTDEAWCAKRNKHYNEPLNIYEIHAGSWKRKEDGEWLNYAELADELIPYMKKLHFNFVEILPLSEYPFDGSWGYQVGGYFSLTSRYGTPEQFAYFVNECHKNNIGVIMDFVPVHFVPDAFSLREYDGTALYEYDSDVGRSEWGSSNFNFYRGEVCSFLSSAAAFWMDVYHCDGIRMDAISNAIYWQGDTGRGVNEGGVKFLQRMNQELHKKFPNAILIAEDSSNFLKVTAPVEYEGLGFDYKWDMGWMHDTLDYFATPFGERGSQPYKLTFSMQYFYNELYMPAFSHDENVHGKKTIIDKLWGTYEEKFAQARLLYLYMYTHPGKKLNFMGAELAQWREWDEKKCLDEKLLKYPVHDAFHKFFAALCALYEKEPALYANDYHPKHFEWIAHGDRADGVFAFLRKDQAGDLLVVLNTLDVERKGYAIKLPYRCTALPLLSSDEERWGGTSKLLKPIKGRGNSKTKEYTLKIELPEISGMIYRLEKAKRKTSKRREREEK